MLSECLRLAQQAPTASYAQSWHFIVVTDTERRAALGELPIGVRSLDNLDVAGRGMRPDLALSFVVAATRGSSSAQLDTPAQL